MKKQCNKCRSIKDLIPLYKRQKDVGKVPAKEWICFPCFSGQIK